MKTKYWAVLLMVVCAIFNAFGFVFFKYAANSESTMVLMFWAGGILLLTAGALLMILAFKGGNLSVLYPMMAVTYIWITIFSIFFFNEDVSYLNWAGVFAIFLGVGMLGMNGGAK